MTLKPSWLSLNWLNISGVHSVIDHALRILPLLISWISFWLLYQVFPPVRTLPGINRAVIILDVALAVLAGLGMEGGRGIPRVRLGCPPEVGIVTVLHERMHQIARFREDVGPASEA